MTYDRCCKCGVLSEDDDHGGYPLVVRLTVTDGAVLRAVEVCIDCLERFASDHSIEFLSWRQ